MSVCIICSFVQTESMLTKFSRNMYFGKLNAISHARFSTRQGCEVFDYDGTGTNRTIEYKNKLQQIIF